MTVCAADGLAVLFRKLPADPIDLALPASLIWSAPLMMLGPSPFWRDFTEFRQRGIVLPVVLMLVWTARWSLSALPAINHPRLPASGRPRGFRAGQPPAWDPGFQHADFREGPTAIYRVSPD